MIVVIGAGGTYALCEYVVPPYYRSEISLIFKRPQNKNPITTDQAGERTLEVFVKAQQQIVMSDLVLARTMIISADENAPLRDKWYELRAKWNEAKKVGNGSARAVQVEIDQWLSDVIAPKVETVLTQQQERLKEFSDSIKLQTPGGAQVAMT